MLRTLLSLALLASFAVGSFAQMAPSKLVVMNLAAHPDDEDGRTLAYYRWAKNAQAYSIIYTRGEGGQNEIGPELYEKLGAIRTVETEKAARILGTQVFSLNYQDFGYSKFAKEAFERWGGKDDVVGEIVYLIRRLKPDVMFTNHDTVTVGRRQHGHHQAVGISAYEAFGLAGDATYRPEQLEDPGVDLWQPKRLFLRYWNKPDEFDASVPVGDIYEATGKSYDEMAAEAISQHASQGMDFFLAQRWRNNRATHTYFKLLRSATEAELDPLDLASNLEPNPTKPSINYLIDSGRIAPMADGVVKASRSFVIPGETFKISWDRSAFSDVRNVLWDFAAPAGSKITMLPDSSGADLTLSPEAIPTIPKEKYQYFRFLNRSPFRFALIDGDRTDLLYADYLDVDIAPPAYLNEVADVVRLRPGANAIAITGTIYDIRQSSAVVKARVNGAGENPVVVEGSKRVTKDEEGRFSTEIMLDLPAGITEGAYSINLTATLDDGFTATREQAARVLNPVASAGLRVGVVESYDNTLVEALSELDVEHRLLTEEDLSTGNFDGLHTILVDIRAYLVRQDLRENNQRLLDWVEQGGHLIVNYQKVFEWNPNFDDPFDKSKKNAAFAPYPLELGRSRVTYENAPVNVLERSDIMIGRPNPLNTGDWSGWVQERGLYFPETYANEYVELFEMNDPGEDPLRSSTLLANYGKGTYIYTALGWYRQLKVFNPGAYRIFANMISRPLEDGRVTTGSN